MTTRMYETMEFEKNFFDDEVRCDYLVTSKTKKIWAVEIDLLDKLLKVCMKYNIKVFAFAGTLLGAIRHKGFIPWDDDMDVCMLREDYNKLIQIANDEFSFPYFFQTAISDRTYFLGYARLRNSNTTGFIKYNKSLNYNNGIYIDIFVMDGYVDDAKLLKKQVTKRDILERLLNSYYADLSVRKGIKKYGVSIIKKIDRTFFSYEKLYDLYNCNLSKFTKSDGRVSLMTHSYFFIERYWCNVTDLKDSIYVEFENIKIPIPQNYHNILKNSYGDYMQLPPVDKRGAWHENLITYDPDTPYKEYVKQLLNMTE